ncbi:MAG TPA: AlpA family phage regulatory protein [Ramlibacter sp.]|nr:AlpA family phage regulatory protein [Ramlibacter sp.]
MQAHSCLGFQQLAPHHPQVGQREQTKRATCQIAGLGEKLSGCQVLALVPVSKSTLWRHVSAGSFPAPVKLFVGVTAWRVDDVRGWIEQRSGVHLEGRVRSVALHSIELHRRGPCT